jgi:hypothetical protein
LTDHAQTVRAEGLIGVSVAGCASLRRLWLSGQALRAAHVGRCAALAMVVLDSSALVHLVTGGLTELPVHGAFGWRGCKSESLKRGMMSGHVNVRRHFTTRSGDSILDGLALSAELRQLGAPNFVHSTRLGVKSDL